MTPRERTDKLAEEFAGTIADYPALRDAIERVIAMAVEAEREAIKDELRRRSYGAESGDARHALGAVIAYILTRGR